MIMLSCTGSLAFPRVCKPTAVEKGSTMLLDVRGPLVSSYASLYPLLPHAGSLSPPRPPFSDRPNLVTQHQHHRSCRRSRRRTRPNSATPGPRLLHPNGGGPEGVPSSLFTFKPRPTPKYTSQQAPSGRGTAADAATTTAAVGEGDLYAGLMEESDLPDISTLLVEVFDTGVVLADGEFSQLESAIIGAPLEMTNNYMRAVAYNEVLYSLKSRCGNRLKNGDFDRSSDALVLAVRDRSRTGGAAKDGDAAGGGGDSARELVAVVELTIRQPDGSLPFNWPLPIPWRRLKPPEQWQPYMCNLAVAEKYRGNGYGKQLVRLCEHVAKNHWGYEQMYLHVDMGDPAATGLYSSMGYESIEKYDAPLWMRKLLGLPTIRYQVKHFKGRKGTATATTTAAGREKDGP